MGYPDTPSFFTSFSRHPQINLDRQNMATFPVQQQVILNAEYVAAYSKFGALLTEDTSPSLPLPSTTTTALYRKTSGSACSVSLLYLFTCDDCRIPARHESGNIFLRIIFSILKLLCYTYVTIYIPYEPSDEIAA